MLEKLVFDRNDLIEQLKLSCKIPEIVELMVTQKIVLETASKAEIKVTKEELQQGADQMRFAQNLTSADATYSWLEKHQLSVEDFEKIVHYSLVYGKLAAHLFGDKVKPYFLEHKLNYTKVVIYEVILDDEDLGIELYYAIKEGEITFYDIAHQYIQEPELRRKGGYRGILKRQDLKPEISAGVFAAKTPEILKPITTSKGVHLIFVEEIIEPILDEKLQYKIVLDLFNQWLKQQIEKIEINCSF